MLTMTKESLKKRIQMSISKVITTILLLIKQTRIQRREMILWNILLFQFLDVSKLKGNKNFILQFQSIRKLLKSQIWQMINQKVTFTVNSCCKSTSMTELCLCYNNKRRMKKLRKKFNNFQLINQKKNFLVQQF